MTLRSIHLDPWRAAVKFRTIISHALTSTDPGHASSGSTEKDSDCVSWKALANRFASSGGKPTSTNFLPVSVETISLDTAGLRDSSAIPNPHRPIPRRRQDSIRSGPERTALADGIEERLAQPGGRNI